jgi:hypothetical protein
MSRRLLLLAASIYLLPSSAIYAERFPLTQAALLAEAQAVVVGTVRELEIQEEQSDMERGSGNYDWAIDLVIDVGHVEKGDLGNASIVVVRCFRIKSRKSFWEFVSVSGNHPIPDVGTEVRAYLYRDHARWRAIYPNGISSAAEAGSETPLKDADAVVRLPSPCYTYLLSTEAWLLLAVLAVPLVCIVGGIMAWRWLERH